MSTMGSYFGDEMIKNYAEVFTESNNGKGLGIAQTLYEQMKTANSSIALLKNIPTYTQHKDSSPKPCKPYDNPVDI